MNKIVLAALAACIGVPAFAAPVLDQSSPSRYSLGLENIGQSFTAGLSGQLSSIDLISPGGTLTEPQILLSIYAGDGYGGLLLGSETVQATITANAAIFDTSALNILVAAGSMYTFHLQSTDGQSAINGGSNNGSNPYAGGSEYFRTYHITGDDLGFQTFVDSAPAAVGSAVPEPASWAMMIGGFGLLGASLRRRPKTAVRFG